MNKLRWLLAPGVGLMLTLIIACGGDKDASPDAAGGSPSREGPQDSLDLARSAASIDSLRSYRFDLTMKLDFGPSGERSGDNALGDALGGAILGLLKDIKAEGAYVAPDQMAMKMSLPGIQVEMIQIGDRAWVKSGGQWQGTEPSQDLFSQSPTGLLGDVLPAEVLSGAKVSKETVNGAKATRYSFNKGSLTELASVMGGSTAELEQLTKANMDVWLNDDGVPVKIKLDMAGKDENGQKVSIFMEMNIRDINSKSIKIEAPV